MTDRYVTAKLVGIRHCIKQIGSNKDWYQVAAEKTYNIILMLLVTIAQICIRVLLNCPLVAFNDEFQFTRL